VEDAALRELFEEAAILFASVGGSGRPALTEARLQYARREMHSGTLSFRQFCDEHKLSPGELFPFTQWITPPTSPRRFHTYFFLSFWAGVFREGDAHVASPDGAEVIQARFVHPRELLVEQRAGRTMLMPPQYYLLNVLAKVFGSHSDFKRNGELLRKISCGPFGERVFSPQILQGVQLDNGRQILTYEGDETRGGPKGARHRSNVKFVKGGKVTEIELESTIDVFGGFLDNTPSKL